MKRLLTLIPALFAVTACGFHPVYGVNKYTPVGAETKFEQVEINNIPDREGQYLRNALIDRFYREGRPTNPAYILDVAPLKESRRNLDVTIDSDTTRAQLTVRTNMTLRDTQSKKTVLQRKLHSTASYNVLGSEYTNTVSEENARRNTLDDLARQIELQIGLYLKR